MMEISAYKRLHEAWMSNNTGSTIEEPVLVIVPIIFLIFIKCACRPAGGFITDFACLVVPLVLSFTLLAYKLYLLPSVLASFCILYFILAYRRSPIKSSYVLSGSYERKPPWITNFRAATNLITVLCILAVDLNIFPRKFAKTETFGFGVMDLGVGFYVFCNGLVHKRTSFSKQLTSVFVLVALGVIRFVSVISIDYHEYVTEYGVHWNFFFTLAVCKLITAIWSHSVEASYFSLALTMGIGQHVILTSGVQSWVLSLNARDDFLEANREGISSILGYVTIYYAAAAYSYHVFSLTPMKALRNTFVFVVIVWVATLGFHRTIGVSRRLCNLGYIFWVLFMTLGMIFLLQVVDVSLRLIGKPRIPRLLASLNRYGLMFFLLGNILTGLININLQTLILPTFQSYGVLFSYMFVVTGIISFLDKS